MPSTPDDNPKTQNNSPEHGRSLHSSTTLKPQWAHYKIRWWVLLVVVVYHCYGNLSGVLNGVRGNMEATIETNKKLIIQEGPLMTLCKICSRHLAKCYNECSVYKLLMPCVLYAVISPTNKFTLLYLNQFISCKMRNKKITFSYKHPTISEWLAGGKHWPSTLPLLQ